MDTAEVVEAAIPESKPSLPENQNQEIVPGTEARKSSKAQNPKLNKKNQVVESARKPAKPTQDAEDSELKRQKIELQIHEAIRRRAIAGVTVSFVGDTAHLKGRVDTESQKSAAEKAARAIAGVKEVRSSIEVSFLVPRDG